MLPRAAGLDGARPRLVVRRATPAAAVRSAAAQASQVISSSISSSRAISSSIPVSSARISDADASLAAEQAPQDRVEEEHRVRAERAVRPARLEEVDGRAGQAAQLDLAGDPLDELVALLVGPLVREAHARTARRRAAAAPSPAGGAAVGRSVSASAVSNAW